MQKFLERPAAAFVFNVLKRPFIAYNNWLERQPIAAKSITSGVMYAAGDGFAQKAEHLNAEKDKSTKSAFRLNWKRLAIFFVYGTFIAGPAYHFWFSRLDLLPAAMFQLRQTRQRAEILKAYALLKRHGIEVNLKLERLPSAKPFSKYAEKGMKIAADQFIFSTLYTLVFFIATGMMTGAVDKWIAEEKLHDLERYESLLHTRYKAAATQHPRDAEFERRLLELKAKMEEAAANHAPADAEETEVVAATPGSATAAAQAAVASASSAVAATPSTDAGAGVAVTSASAETTESETPDPEPAEVSKSIDNILTVLREEHAQKSLSWSSIWTATWQHCKDVFWETYVADCAVWPALQYVNFSVVPPQYRSLYVNVCNLAWNTFLSLQANSVRQH